MLISCEPTNLIAIQSYRSTRICRCSYRAGISLAAGLGTSWRGSVRAAPTVIVRYEGLLIAPVNTVLDSFKKLGVLLPAVSGAVPDFEVLRARISDFLRLGQ